ncbi:MAG: hypothetical protein KC652_11605, partial [Cyanobacteria bacterium HKST-UBA01]|nr:hypothetical protein [Cyanobacteria bacterium HKST-UBA01]
MKSSSALNRSKPVVAATVALIGFALGLGITSNSSAFGQGQGGGGIPLQMPFNNNAPNPMQGILNQPLTNSGPGAIVVPPISFVDINTGRFGKLEIDLDDGEFMEGSCKNIHLVARDMDLREGLLKSLDIS